MRFDSLEKHLLITHVLAHESNLSELLVVLRNDVAVFRIDDLVKQFVAAKLQQASPLGGLLSPFPCCQFFDFFFF